MVRQRENRDTERTFVNFVQLAHRGKGENKKERRVGVDLTSFPGKTGGQKSLTSQVSVTESDAENQCED